MPYSLVVDTDERCVFFVHRPAFRLEEVDLSFKALFNGPDFETGMNIFRDTSAIALPPNLNYDRMTMVTVENMLPYNSRLGACRIAWLVGSQVDFGIVNQLSLVLGGEAERRPFLDTAEAHKWLGLPAGYEIGGAEGQAAG